VTRPGALGLASLALLLAQPAAAHDFERAHGAGTPDPDRLMGMAELGLGWIVLPGAEVCVERSQAGCTRGDSSLELEAWQLFRASGVFAVGAGLTLGLTPTTDAPRQDPEGIERDHTRRYLTIEGTVRYYPYLEPTLEAWVGLTAGLVVVSDRFESTQGKQEVQLVGPEGVTIRSEGYTVGLAVGAAYIFAPNWSVGGAFRYGNWFLPSEPARDPLGDEASLVGRNSVFGLGASIAYRVSL
jgi:hypothetical protein